MPAKADYTALSLRNLMDDLNHQDPSARLEAAAALDRMGPRAKAAVPALAGALKDADVHVRKMAALALGDIGPDAGGAVPALVEALRDESEAVRRRVAVALGEIGVQ